MGHKGSSYVLILHKGFLTKLHKERGLSEQVASPDLFTYWGHCFRRNVEALF